MSANETVAQTLAGSLATIVFDGLSETAKRVATASIIDTIGAMFLGASGPVVAALQTALADDLVAGPAFVFGRASRAGVLDAALLNGTSAHAEDYDDMACSMGGRPSAPLVPVILALGEALGASGTQVVEAYVVGFEAECRIGRVVNPHHYEGGWHPTSTLGVFGAAAAAARLLGLDRDRTSMALALAASMASGLKANFGTMAKPLQVGQCARSGLMAAKLANIGFTANLAVLEHPRGFFASYDGLDNIHLERLLDHRHGRLEIEQDAVGLKSFPCCGSTHPAARAMLALRARGLHPEDVDSILMTVNRRRLPHTNNPSPKTPLEARFSIQYVAARALLDGAPRLHHFEGRAHLDPDVRALMRKMSVVAYPAHAGDEGQDECNEFEADVTVLTHSGDQLEANAPHALGRGGEDPMTNDELWTKFSDCASRSLGSGQVRAVFTALQQLTSCARISDLMDLMLPRPVVVAGTALP
jgi:2-methylcitrate dehydratase PrpD